MEVKFLRGKNTTQELAGLQADFTRLRGVTSHDLRSTTSLSACGAPGKWQIIVAQRDAYDKLSRSRSQKFAGVVEMLKTASSTKPPRLVYQSVIATKLKEELHWHVTAIGEARWPFPVAQNS
jgi:hypothetical protein